MFTWDGKGISEGKAISLVWKFSTATDKEVHQHVSSTHNDRKCKWPPSHSCSCDIGPRLTANGGELGNFLPRKLVNDGIWEPSDAILISYVFNSPPTSNKKTKTPITPNQKFQTPLQSLSNGIELIILLSYKNGPQDNTVTFNGRCAENLNGIM